MPTFNGTSGDDTLKGGDRDRARLFRIDAGLEYGLQTVVSTLASIGFARTLG